MSTKEHLSIVPQQPNVSEPAREEALEKVLAIAPRGAFVLAALMVGTMLAGWLALYFLLFLPRGVIG